MRGVNKRKGERGEGGREVKELGGRGRGERVAEKREAKRKQRKQVGEMLYEFPRR